MILEAANIPVHLSPESGAQGEVVEMHAWANSVVGQNLCRSKSPSPAGSSRDSTSTFIHQGPVLYGSEPVV